MWGSQHDRARGTLNSNSEKKKTQKNNSGRKREMWGTLGRVHSRREGLGKKEIVNEGKEWLNLCDGPET